MSSALAVLLSLFALTQNHEGTSGSLGAILGGSPGGSGGDGSGLELLGGVTTQLSTVPASSTAPAASIAPVVALPDGSTLDYYNSHPDKPQDAFIDIVPPAPEVTTGPTPNAFVGSPAAAAAASSSTVSGLIRPSIVPSYDNKTLQEQMRAAIAAHAVNVTWTAIPGPGGKVTHSCAYEAKYNTHYNNISVADFECIVFTLSDCPNDPWPLCIHKDAKEGHNDIITAFGELPVGMRDHITSLNAYPRYNPKDNMTAYTRGQASTIPSGYWTNGVMAHEFSHALDVSGFDKDVLNGSTWFSMGPLWYDALYIDKRTASWYASETVARGEWREAFADAGRVAVYDLTVPGGTSAINPNMGLMLHQMQLYEHYLGKVILPANRTCTGNRPRPTWVTFEEAKSVKRSELPPHHHEGLEDVLRRRSEREWRA